MVLLTADTLLNKKNKLYGKNYNESYMLYSYDN